MRKILLTCLMLVFVLYAWAQDRTVSGKVTDGESGEGLPGVNVLLKGTGTGVTTDLDGNYKISVPSDGGSLIFTFIGKAKEEVVIGAKSVINVQLYPDIEQLSEVVVTGVGDATSRKKLTVTVGKISGDLIQEVPALNAASSLQGKIAGVRVTSTGGAPGSSPDIKMRAATTIAGSQAPLVIIDGVISENGLGSVNSNDIATMEVVKGAAAASIYGSRAANGVLNITTKRGENLDEGQTEVVIRSEYGISELPRLLPINMSHNRFVPEGEEFDYGVHSSLKTDNIMDVPFETFNNYQESLFDPGSFNSNYVRVATRSKKTNFSVSFEDQNQSGVIFLSDGYNRKNVRLNADHFAFDEKLKLTASTFLSQTTNDVIPTGDGSVLFNLLKLPGNQDPFEENEDGSPYKWQLNPVDPAAINPLYAIANRKITDVTTRNMTNLGATYYFTNNIRLEGQYGRDEEIFNRKDFNDNTWIAVPGSARTTGQLLRRTDKSLGETFRLNLFAAQRFGDFNTGLRLSYLYEKYDFDSFGFTGNNLTFSGLQIPTALQQSGPSSNLDYPFSLQGSFQTILAENYFAVFNVDYKEKYLFDALVRNDGVSLFGENERRATFFRVSGAWRISEDFSIPGVQEMKIRGSYGTAGNRPPFFAQYERYTVNGNKAATGNANLRREITSELEVGYDVSFGNRFTFEAAYSQSDIEDLILEVPLPVSLSGGFPAQFQNAGSMQAKVLELSFNANIVNKKDFRWSAGVVFDRIRSSITSLNTPFLRVGPNPNNLIGQGLFYLTEGNVYGEMWGNVLLTDVSQLTSEQNPEDYVKNSDGYLIPINTIGTINEAPQRVLDENGQALYTKIGDANPDFNLGFNTNLNYKGIGLYAVVDWKQGGNVYNQTKQWMYFNAGTHGDQDMSGVPQELKKPSGYYQNGLYNANNPVDFFVEDASWVKLREVAVSYTLNKDRLSNIGVNFLREVKLSVLGRNLFMLTPYTGYDPEVARTGALSSNNDGGGDGSLFAYDGFSYPNLRTYTGSLTITF